MLQHVLNLSYMIKIYKLYVVFKRTYGYFY